VANLIAIKQAHLIPQIELMFGRTSRGVISLLSDLCLTSILVSISDKAYSQMFVKMLGAVLCLHAHLFSQNI
jgi:hypothetical protein